MKLASQGDIVELTGVIHRFRGGRNVAECRVQVKSDFVRVLLPEGLSFDSWYFGCREYSKGRWHVYISVFIA
jgi:hypothetical protein